MGMNDDDASTRSAKIVATMSTPMAMLICPSRRRVVLYPQRPGMTYYYKFGTLPTPALVGKTDYAGNGGSTYDGTNMPGGPSSLSQGDSWPPTQWKSQFHATDTGVIFTHSAIAMNDITDGASCTYLIGEKYCDPDHYTDGMSDWDDQVWDLGMDWDVIRNTGSATSWTDLNYVPQQDTPGLGTGLVFGSAHPTGFHMAFCDGSVQFINYTIDYTTHQCLGNRMDGRTINGNKF
jgi:prepilin-type processing-associated H-X9-DG protein